VQGHGRERFISPAKPIYWQEPGRMRCPFLPIYLIQPIMYNNRKSAATTGHPETATATQSKSIQTAPH
jgi:hypothetical protein